MWIILTAAVDTRFHEIIASWFARFLHAASCRAAHKKKEEGKKEIGMLFYFNQFSSPFSGNEKDSRACPAESRHFQSVLFFL